MAIWELNEHFEMGGVPLYVLDTVRVIDDAFDGCKVEVGFGYRGDYAFRIHAREFWKQELSFDPLYKAILFVHNTEIDGPTTGGGV